MTETEISFSSTTDKMETITHLINKFLAESGGDIVLQNARTQTLEKLDELEGETQQDQDELDSFDGNEFDNLIQSKKEFSTTNGPLGEVIENVRTIGNRPRWLELPNSSNQSENNTDGLLLTSTASSKEDDFSTLSCLTKHQPEALKENGYNTFTDLWQAEINDLTRIPGIRKADAKTLKEEASSRVDATEAIAREAYRRESESSGSTVLGDNGIVEAGADANKLTSVKVPAGEPRNPQVYDGTPLPRHAHGLPILKHPAFSSGILKDYIEDCDNLEDLISVVRTLSKFTTQEEAVVNEIRNNVETIDGLKETINQRPNEVENWLTQPGVTASELQNAIELESNTEISNNIDEVTNNIDSHLADSVPERSRIRLIYKMREILHQEQDMDAILDDATITDLVAESSTPTEIDHPFIHDRDEYPELKTRTTEMGERDVNTVARLAGKNTYAVDLVGHAGVGKDTLIKILAAVTNRPVQIVNMDNSMIAQHLYGEHKIDETGRIIFEDGIFPHGMKYGFWIVLSEVNAAPGGILSTLHQVFESDSSLHVKQSDEIISPSPRFRIATTRNPPTEDYSGMEELNGAFEDRLNSLRLDYLDKEQEIDLIDEMANDDRRIVTEDQIDSLVSMANTFRENASSPTSNYPRLTPRNLVQIIDKYDGTDNLVGAAKETIKVMLSERELQSGEDILERVEDHF